MAERKSRRRFLADGALVLAGAVAATSEPARAAPAPDAGAPSAAAPAAGGAAVGPAPATLTPDDFAHAERIERVTMTPAQRAMAAESWEFNIGPFFARRDFPLGDEPPGMIWNPVLKG